MSEMKVGEVRAKSAILKKRRDLGGVMELLRYVGEC